MLELNTIEISMTKVDILENNNKLTNLQNNIKMDKRCLDNMKCIIETHTYLLLDQPTKCKWAKIQTIQLISIQLVKKGILNNYYVNREHRIILRKINQKNLEECQVTATTTDYPEIMLIEGNQDKLSEITDMMMHPESLDMDLELRISEEYLHYKMEGALQEQVTRGATRGGGRACTLP